MYQIYYVLKTIRGNMGVNIIKVISITLGLTLSILLFTRQAFEFNFDNCYEESDRLYILKIYWTVAGERYTDGSFYCMGPLGGAIADYFPEEVEDVTVTRSYWQIPFYYGDLRTMPQTTVADSAFFKTIGWHLIEGNLQDINTPDVVFISEDYAQKTFAGKNPVGEVLMYKKNKPMTVKGVYKDFPENSSFYQNDVLFSMSTHQRDNPNQWSWNGGDSYPTYIRLKKNVDDIEFNKRINDVFLTYNLQGDTDDIKWDVELIPIKNYRIEQLYSEKGLIWILILLAAIILFIVTLNYILISISSLSRRAKAIGVYKCNGAGKGTILGMFLLETAIIIFISVLLMIFIFINFKDFIEDMTYVSLRGMFSWSNLWVPASVIAFLFLIGGILPGRIFANIPVTQVFRRYTEGKKGWKKPLLFSQFIGVAFVLSLLAITISQTHHIVSLKRGFTTANMAFEYAFFDNPDNARTTLLDLPYVENVSSSEQPLFYSMSGIIISTDGGKQLGVRYNRINGDYLPFIDLKLKEGRLANKNDEFIVNQEFVDAMKWEDSPIGKNIREADGSIIGSIVGVTMPFRSQNITYAEPLPIIMFYKDDFNYCIQVKLKEPFEENLKKLNEDSKRFWPDKDINFIAVSKEVNQQYQSIKAFRNVSFMAAVAIIFITLMGLLGYVNDETQRRSKEIAIRKVNGAEAKDVLVMLSKNIIWIALPAVIIGVIIGWLAGSAWLEMFTQVTYFPPVYYVLIGLLVLAFIIGCVIIRAWRIANDNPVNSIKSE